MAMTAPSWELPSTALTDSRNLRFFVVFILYVAQGLPLGLFYYALPAWQAQNGASAAAVGGVLAMTSLPWTLKLINGVVMDRFSFLAMGRRRPWLIAGQTAIMLGLLLLAWTNPDAKAASILGAFAFAINVATTVQDVAIDGMAVDIIPETEFGRANGFMFGGQAIGISIGSALSGYLIAYYGFAIAMLTLAALVGSILHDEAFAHHGDNRSRTPGGETSSMDVRNRDRFQFRPPSRRIFADIPQLVTRNV